MQIYLSKIKRDTIIAALRLWQGYQFTALGDDGLLEIANGGRTGRDTRMSAEEIDRLCEILDRS